MKTVKMGRNESFYICHILKTNILSLKVKKKRTDKNMQRRENGARIQKRKADLCEAKSEASTMICKQYQFTIHSIYIHTYI